MRKTLFASMVLLILVSLPSVCSGEQEITFKGTFVESGYDLIPGSSAFEGFVTIDEIVSGPTLQKGRVLVYVPQGLLSKASVDSEIKEGDKVEVRGYYKYYEGLGVNPIEKSHYVKKCLKNR